MEPILQYSINIAMESTMILVLAVVLITCLLQKRALHTTNALVYLLVSIILLLINQIVFWSLFIGNVHQKYGEDSLRIVYILDYVLVFSITISFFYYIVALIKDGYKQIGVSYNPGKTLQLIIFAWGILSIIIYLAGVFNPTLYRLEDGAPVYNVAIYVILNIMSKFACVCGIVLLIYHRKVISKQETFLSITFILLASLLVIVDELSGFSVSYILISLFALVLYVRIDLHKGLLLERKEREITQWKTQIMLSQMQPHFLYNVLTTISGMCEIDNALQARDVVNRFADYFRINLQSLGKENTIPFEKELEHVKTYLWLEKIRFEDELQISYDIETTDFFIPSLALQPMVENAVKHGILPKEDGGRVTIRTRETTMGYEVVVEDDGVGFDVTEKWDSQVHVGIENVSKRLELICNGTCTIHSEKGKGTVVTIHIPK